MFDIVRQPWPWYVAGALIGLIVPALLLLGNKHFGISSSLRHICAACFPSDIRFFKYNWKRESWNLFFVGGIVVGALLAVLFLNNHQPLIVHPKLAADMAAYGITDKVNVVPSEIVSWHSLFTFRGLIMMVGGGFLVGFGTRYAGGCTSGHSIMGLSELQWPSLVATCCFMAGGFLMSNVLLPFILKL
ncbi:MAG: YeeE/YedE family protein [Bacteroidetes bacterium]|nr:YeeE/YedE family protein [Bacteroidota bacterium]